MIAFNQSQSRIFTIRCYVLMSPLVKSSPEPLRIQLFGVQVCGSTIPFIDSTALTRYRCHPLDFSLA